MHLIQDSQCTYNVTMRRVRAAIFALGKQRVLNKLSVCICCCSTVHFDKYQSFLWPTNAHFINTKMLIKCAFVGHKKLWNWVCVFVALVILHAMRMGCIVICGLPSSTILFVHYLIKGKVFGKKSYWTRNVCFVFLCKFYLKHFSF
jgi:hypothetical protein